MGTVFACTSVEKIATKYSPETGSEISGQCVLSESCNVRAGSFADLLKKLEERYTFQPINDVFMSQEEGEPVEHFGWNQFEDRHGNAVDGTEDCYLCDFTFSVEVRETRPLTMDEVKATVTTH